MPFVKQIALFLNLSIPLYFFYYQLLQSHLFQQQNTRLNLIEILLQILKASIVFISPVLHILALRNPPYCFKGHCPTPQHCMNQPNEISNNYSPNLTKFKDKHFKNNKEQDLRSPRHNLVKFTDQNDDIIKQSRSSSKEENLKNQLHLFDRKDNRTRIDTGLFLRLQKIEHPQEQQKPSSLEKQKNLQQSVNVNEFSNIPFFRNSRRSLSNIGNNDSPRISRRSVVERGSILIQPLISLTPRKHSQLIQITPKKMLSSNFSSQGTQMIPRLTLQCEYCQDCQIPKYLRMKHCYRCQKCVHKYDHHCVLLNICIGQVNQKYYIAFLYAHFYNTVLLLHCLLVLIKDDVFIDEITGIQYLSNGYTLKAFGIIVLLLNFILTSYLIFIHTNFFFNGSTTYEKERRETINYFKHVKKNYYSFEDLKGLDKDDLQTYHPFDEGCLTNALKIIKAEHKPYDWQLPYKECNTIIELKERKYNPKKSSQGRNRFIHEFRRQWGEQSESSNNLHAGKTTKSRQSVNRKSKQEEEKQFQKIFTKK